MPKCGQLRVGAAWVGGKEPDILSPGRLRYYDKRMRTRIFLGATVQGSIAKNSTFRIWPGNGYYGSVKGKRYQQHYKYYRNIGTPGSNQAKWQTVFRQAMQEVKNLTEEQRAPYRIMEKEYYKKYHTKPGTYKARGWLCFYLMERLPQLYPGY